MGRRVVAAFAALLAIMPLSGCGSFLTAGTSDAAGLAGAGIASAVSRDATTGAAIGLAAASLANASLLFAERRVHRTQQDSIATVAGGLAEGAVGAWRVTHTLPIEDDEDGQVAVTRVISGPDFTCKEIIFSVDHNFGTPQKREFFTAFICLDGTQWRWASAEPATARWGALQ